MVKPKKMLKAKDIERLENTSVATPLVLDGGDTSESCWCTGCCCTGCCCTGCCWTGEAAVVDFQDPTNGINDHIEV